MIRLLALLVLLALAACGSEPAPKGDPIPLKRLFAETPQYECASYDASSDSCEGISLRRVEGNRVIYDEQFVMPTTRNIPGRAHVRMTASFAMEPTRYCGDFRNADVEVTGVPSSYAIDLAIIFKTQVARMGVMCTRYYRQPDGTYLSVTTRPDGAAIQDGTAAVRFLTGPKKLRSISAS